MSQVASWLSDQSLNLAISVCAILISVYSVVRQFRIRGPNVIVLNESNDSPIIMMPYERLPQNVRDDFPVYDEANANYALCSIVFANSGDLGAFVLLEELSFHPDFVKVARYNYVRIGPGEIVSHRLVLRNIPDITPDQPLKVAITVKMKWGGISTRMQRMKLRTQTANLQVTIYRSFAG